MAHVDGPRSPAAEPGPARRCAASPPARARAHARAPRPLHRPQRRSAPGSARATAHPGCGIGCIGGIRGCTGGRVGSCEELRCGAACPAASFARRPWAGLRARGTARQGQRPNAWALGLAIVGKSGKTVQRPTESQKGAAISIRIQIDYTKLLGTKCKTKKWKEPDKVRIQV